jgi:hypothetical protein
VLVDLTAIQRENPEYFALARDQLRRELRPAIRAELDRKGVQHYSIFALAPIPVLICLGRELGNKVTTDVFQKQRDQSWRWREDGPRAQFEFRKLRDGTEAGVVVMQLSISGQISELTLPTELERATVYEISPRRTAPSVDCVRRREDLDAFRKTYRDGLTSIHTEHGTLAKLCLLPAVPATVAVACGQEIMPKAHAALAIYDNVKGTFREAIVINTEDDL